MDTITGNKVALAPITPADVRLFETYMADLEVASYFGYLGESMAPGGKTAWYECVTTDPNSRHFAIRVDDRTIGRVAIFGINHRHQHAEYGIMIGDPTCWGRGYGTDATRLMCDYGLFHLGLRNLFLWVYGYNTRAIRAYARAGFWEAGRMREWIWFGERWHDAIMMQCNREGIGPTRFHYAGV